MDKTTLAIVAVAGVMAGGAYVLPAAAQAPPPPIVGEPLTPRSVFADDIGLKFRIKLDGARRTSSTSRTRRGPSSSDTPSSPERSSRGTAIPARWSSTWFRGR